MPSSRISACSRTTRRHPRLVAAYTSAEAQNDFPQYDHFAQLFEEASPLEMALAKAASLAVNDIQPLQVDDQSMHEGAEDNVEWALDRLKEENYADDNAPENDADTSGGYIPKGSEMKRPIDKVDKAERSNVEPPPKQLRRSSRIEKLKEVQ